MYRTRTPINRASGRHRFTAPPKPAFIVTLKSDCYAVSRHVTQQEAFHALEAMRDKDRYMVRPAWEEVF